ncbi:MAG: GyrI-like domain-containing protein [Bacteroidetes bacterium]|nr:MAG: GyrI-like domain-containing protein [Bacteroidota bacterium]
MKRIIVAIGILLTLLIASIYIFIPQKLKISSAIKYEVNGEGLFRFLLADSNWGKWWPGKISTTQDSKKIFSYSEYDYSIKEVLYHSLELTLSKNQNAYKSLLKIISFEKDSTVIEIGSELTSGSDPINRIQNYFSAKKLKSSFDDLLSALKDHTKNIHDLYGYDIKNEKVQMQFLLSTSKVFSHYPTTEDIYSLVNIIRDYIKTTDGKEEFSPMLNIESKDSINYYVRVGVPVNKNLPGKENISLKQMVKNGNILVAEVKGDQKTINEAIKQIEQYIIDYQRSNIAIPFQSLITDRSKEPDSTKWITKIYYPVV